MYVRPTQNHVYIQIVSSNPDVFAAFVSNFTVLSFQLHKNSKVENDELLKALEVTEQRHREEKLS